MPLKIASVIWRPCCPEGVWVKGLVIFARYPIETQDSHCHTLAWTAQLRKQFNHVTWWTEVSIPLASFCIPTPLPLCRWHQRGNQLNPATQINPADLMALAVYQLAGFLPTSNYWMLPICTCGRIFCKSHGTICRVRTQIWRVCGLDTLHPNSG